jgi:hypothetical protein
LRDFGRCHRRARIQGHPPHFSLLYFVLVSLCFVSLTAVVTYYSSSGPDVVPQFLCVATEEPCPGSGLSQFELGKHACQCQCERVRVDAQPPSPHQGRQFVCRGCTVYTSESRQTKSAQFVSIVFENHAKWNVRNYVTTKSVSFWKTRHYGYRPSKQALHIFCDFDVPAGITGIYPPFIHQRALMAHRAFQAGLARPTPSSSLC